MKLMKGLAMVVACAFTCLVSADSLDRFVPEDTNLLAKLRPQMMLDLSVVKDNDTPQIKEWREILNKINLTGATLPDQAMVLLTAKYNNSPAAIMTVTNTPAQMKTKLDQMVKDFPALSYTKLTDKNYPGFRLVSTSGEGEEKEENAVNIYYLDKNVIALLEENSIPPAELKAGAKPAAILDSFKDVGNLEMARVVTNGSSLGNGAGVNGLNSLALKLSKTTDPAIAFLLDATLGFIKPEDAMQIAAMGQFFLSMGLMQATNDAKLAEQVGKEIKIQADGTKVQINASISEALIKMLKEKMKNQIPNPDGQKPVAVEETTVEVETTN